MAIMNSVKTSIAVNNLSSLRNTRIVIEPGQKCVICRGVMMNDSEIGLTEDRSLVHLHCLEEAERDKLKTLVDLF